MALAAAMVMVGGVVGFLGTRGSVDRVEVVLEPVEGRGVDPFTSSVVSAGVVVSELDGFSTAGAASRSGPRVSRVRGDQSGLYGSRAEGPVCDRDALAVRLLADDDLARVWAGAQGIEVAAVGDFVAGLTPVVLGRDTLVTNHTYSAGGASAFRSVLQAGSPVLVDDRGVPRVQCTCGNPLGEAEIGGQPVDFEGEQWDGFDESAITEVGPAVTPVTEIETVDVDSEEPVALPVRPGPAEPVTESIDGLLVADDEGIHVYSEAGEKLTTVLDEPVEAVFDDGAGGLVWQAPRPDGADATDPVSDPAVNRLWHLPAGASEPEVVVEGRDPATDLVRLATAGRLGDESFVAFTRGPDPATAGSDPIGRDLVIRDLATGEETVLEEDGDLVVEGEYSLDYRQITRVAGFNGEHFVYANYVATGEYEGDVTWQLVAAGPTKTPGGCGPVTDTYGVESSCPTSGTLDTDGTVVAIEGSETGESVVGYSVGDPRGEQGPRPVDATIGGYLGEWEGDTLLDVHDGRAVYSWEPDEGHEDFPTTQTDLADGATTDLPLPGLVRYLRAPLVRPVDGGSPPTGSTGSTTTTAPPEVPTISVDEAIEATHCSSPCQVTGSVTFDHPTWGPVVMVSTSDGAPASAALVVIDRRGQEVWRYDNDQMYTFEIDDPPTDDTGHLFVRFNPGRYDGVIVLDAVEDGFEDFDTLPPRDDFSTRFYSAETMDRDGDGTLEVEVSENDCDPSCADGTTTVTPFRWDGSDYIEA